MKITRHNYETYLIDYLDGNLSSEIVQELLLFLEENPDIKNEFENIDQVSLAGEAYKMPGKHNLKKNETAIPEFDSRCIACLEGDLDASEKSAFEKEILQSEKNSNTFKLYSLAKLKPDHRIVFPDKESLKRQVKSYRKLLLYTSLSAAAGLLLIAGFFALNNGQPEYSSANNLAYSEVNFEERFLQFNREIIRENVVNENEPVKAVFINKRKESAPIHQPDFIAVQMSDESLNQDKEKENKKNVKPESKEKADTTKNFIIPNEILLKQNEKQLADNTVKKQQPQVNKNFVYYLEQGVKGFKSLTGKNVDMERRIDENGKTKQFAFNIGKVKVSHTKSE